ncbi:MAG: winged helix-turn-helix domain-containing protein [Candidatus Bathyarchaeia archaeon]
MLKLMLTEDDHVLLKLPLSARAWERGELKRELDSLDRDLERFLSLLSALSNAGRVRMMSALFERLDRPYAFTELMSELGMNPKLVWDSTRRLRRVGLIEKDDDGRYRPTREGEAQFLMVGVALRRLLQILGEL